MPQPEYTPAWHQQQADDERAWLDQWARLHLIPVTEHPEPAPAPVVPSLVSAGSH